MPLEKFNTLVCSADCSLTSLHWYKEKDGVKHEFLVVQVTPTGGGDPVWIRLDRAAKRAHANTRRLRLWSDISSSKFLADDSASIWTEKADACGGTQCDETYSCKFPGQPPLRLERFAGLLKIFVEESPFYTLVKVSIMLLGCSLMKGEFVLIMHHLGELLVFLLHSHGSIKARVSYCGRKRECSPSWFGDGCTQTRTGAFYEGDQGKLKEIHRDFITL